MKAFVAGATGQTGRRIVQELVKRNIPVRALVRNLEKGRETLPPEAELIVGDVLKPESLGAAIGDSTVILCATGSTPTLFDPTGPYKIDYEGTKNLIDVAKTKGIEHFVLVSSLGVSQPLYPLNIAWGVLWWKKGAEEHLEKSGLTYTIVRPGGLRNEDNSDPVVMESADRLYLGTIPRTKVAQACVEALMQPEARNKIVEVIAKPEASDQSWDQLFARVS